MVTHHQLLHHKEIMVVLQQQEIVAVQVEAVQELSVQTQAAKVLMVVQV
jgi:hypothetical protein